MEPQDETPTPRPEDIVQTLIKAFDQMVQLVKDAVAIISRWGAETVTFMARLLDEAETWNRAYHWAEKHRPKWVAIMNRTKKRRIVNKYRNRILKAYKEERK